MFTGDYKTVHSTEDSTDGWTVILSKKMSKRERVNKELSRQLFALNAERRSLPHGKKGKLSKCDQDFLKTEHSTVKQKIQTVITQLHSREWSYIRQHQARPTMEVTEETVNIFAAYALCEAAEVAHRLNEEKSSKKVKMNLFNFETMDELKKKGSISQSLQNNYSFLASLNRVVQPVYHYAERSNDLLAKSAGDPQWSMEDHSCTSALMCHPYLRQTGVSRFEGVKKTGALIDAFLAHSSSKLHRLGSAILIFNICHVEFSEIDYHSIRNIAKKYFNYMACNSARDFEQGKYYKHFKNMKSLSENERDAVIDYRDGDSVFIFRKEPIESGSDQVTRIFLKSMGMVVASTRSFTRGNLQAFRGRGGRSLVSSSRSGKGSWRPR